MAWGSLALQRQRGCTVGAQGAGGIDCAYRFIKNTRYRLFPFKRQDEAYAALPKPDFSRLDIRSVICYRIYRQDGSLKEMMWSNTLDNRMFVDWVQRFDRYTEHEA
jgi:hypothetical protein